MKKKWDFWPFTKKCEVTAIRFSCQIQDLYDFNYEDDAPGCHAAALQIGYANGGNPPSRTHGKIFRHEIQIKTTYLNPFKMTGP